MGKGGEKFRFKIESFHLGSKKVLYPDTKIYFDIGTESKNLTIPLIGDNFKRDVLEIPIRPFGKCSFALEISYFC